jgi:hypothetical protein
MSINSHLSTCVGTQSPKYLEMAQGTFPFQIRVRATPQRSHRREARAFHFLRGGVVDLVFFLLLLEVAAVFLDGLVLTP